MPKWLPSTSKVTPCPNHREIAHLRRDVQQVVHRSSLGGARHRHAREPAARAGALLLVSTGESFDPPSSAAATAGTRGGRPPERADYRFRARSGCWVRASRLGSPS